MGEAGTMEEMEATIMEEMGAGTMVTAMEITTMEEMEATIMEEMGVGTMVTVIVAVLTQIMEVVVDQTQIMEIMATTMVAQIPVNKSTCIMYIYTTMTLDLKKFILVLNIFMLIYIIYCHKTYNFVK